MNTTLSTRVDEQNHHHQQHQSPQAVPLASRAVRRVGLADRVALHVGLALVTWSRRPLLLAEEPSWNERHSKREHELAKVQRERQWLLMLSVSQPRR